MDAGEGGRVDRTRRAAVVIGIALTAILLAGLVYLHPAGSSQRRILPGALESPSPPWLPDQVAATYDFISPATGWSVVSEFQVTSAMRFWVFGTDDGATTWRQQFGGTCESIGASWVHFFDRRNGMVSECSPAQVFRTVDGGAHWTSLPVAAYSPDFVSFSDPLDGLLASAAPQPSTAVSLLSTVDGGQSWRALPLPSGFSPDLNTVQSGKGAGASLEFDGRYLGWLGVAGTQVATVYSTADRGITWSVHLLPLPVLTPAQGKAFFAGWSTQVVLLPAHRVLVLAWDAIGDSFAFVSADEGSTWAQLPLPPGSTLYTDYEFVDATHWWAMRNGTLFKSDDAGQTWHQSGLILDGFDYAPAIIDGDHAWAELTSVLHLAPGTSAQVQQGLAMTSDGGLHWTYVNVPQPRLS